MIKLLLKYKIIDVAIEVLFDKLSATFSSPHKQDMLVGRRLNSVTIVYSEYTEPEGNQIYTYCKFYNCIILKVNSDSIIIEYKSYSESTYDHNLEFLDSILDESADTGYIYIDDIVKVEYA